MEIGAFVLLVIIGLAIVFGEKTEVGNKISEWGLKNLCDIDINKWRNN